MFSLIRSFSPRIDSLKMFCRPDGDDDEDPNVDLMKGKLDHVSSTLKDTKPSLENYPQKHDYIKSERIASRFVF